MISFSRRKLKYFILSCCGNSENILELKECEEKLKNYYKNDYKFYLVQIDINEQIESENKKSFSSQSKYKIYRTNGKEEFELNIIPAIKKKRG